MRIVLHSKPATPEDVAEILGVPKSRVKWLRSLVDARRAASGKARARKLAKNGAKTAAIKGRKSARGKGKKVAH